MGRADRSCDSTSCVRLTVCRCVQRFGNKRPFLVLRSFRSPLLYLTPSGTALVIPPEATCHPRECQDHTSMNRRPPSSTMMVAVLVAACAAGEQVNCSDRRAPIWLQFVHRRRGDSRSSACTIILSLLMAGQREEFYSIKGCYATLPIATPIS